MTHLSPERESEIRELVAALKHGGATSMTAAALCETVAAYDTLKAERDAAVAELKESTSSKLRVAQSLLAERDSAVARAEAAEVALGEALDAAEELDSKLDAAYANTARAEAMRGALVEARGYVADAVTYGFGGRALAQIDAALALPADGGTDNA